MGLPYHASQEDAGMRHSHQGPVRGQISFLRRQFLQEGGLPFSNVLSHNTIAPALETLQVRWNPDSKGLSTLRLQDTHLVLPDQ
jgi:hypothetical protein